MIRTMLIHADLIFTKDILYTEFGKWKWTMSEDILDGVLEDTAIRVEAST